MHKQKSLKLFMLLFIFLILDVPNLCSGAKRYPSYSQGKATTRRTQPSKPNEEATKLSYGSYQSQRPVQNQVNPPQYNQAPSAPTYNPPQTQYHPQSQYQPQPPPPYSQTYPQPAGFQPASQQPIIVNHVQQPQSSGGLGTAGGLAIGALGGAVGGYALSEALKGDGDKKEETTEKKTEAPEKKTEVPEKKEEIESTTSVAGANGASIIIKDPALHLNESIVEANSTTHEFENATIANNATESVDSSTPLTEVLFESKNSTETHSSLVNDATGAKISLNIALLAFIFNFIL